VKLLKGDVGAGVWPAICGHERETFALMLGRAGGSDSSGGAIEANSIVIQIT